jgi:hypothetical protein
LSGALVGVWWNSDTANRAAPGRAFRSLLDSTTRHATIRERIRERIRARLQEEAPMRLVR